MKRDTKGLIVAILSILAIAGGLTVFAYLVSWWALLAALLIIVGILGLTDE
jgi:hypothetical protein